MQRKRFKFIIMKNTKADSFFKLTHNNFINAWNVKLAVLLVILFNFTGAQAMSNLKSLKFFIDVADSNKAIEDGSVGSFVIVYRTAQPIGVGQFAELPPVECVSKAGRCVATLTDKDIKIRRGAIFNAWNVRQGLTAKVRFHGKEKVIELTSKEISRKLVTKLNPTLFDKFLNFIDGPDFIYEFEITGRADFQQV